jgi:integrase
MPSKIAPVVHFPALPYEEVGVFMETLRTKEGMGARALEFTILTAARSGEIRGATWGEIDFNKAKWTIPVERMKANVEHEVPLSAGAIALLRELPRTADPHVFPGSKEGVPLSDQTLSKVIRRMGDAKTTVHGFRSTFRDWVAEKTSYSREVGEKALAHAVGDASEQAYKRGHIFEKRRLMMEEWATYCGTIQPAGADVQSLSQWRGVKNATS